MRFGRNFPWHQLPKWADFYVDYDEWESLVKTAKFNGKFFFILQLKSADEFCLLRCIYRT